MKEFWRKSYNITKKQHKTILIEEINLKNNYMIQKIVLLWAILICYNTTFAQHMEFEGVPFDNSLETIHSEFVNRALPLVKQEYDEYSGGELFYNGMYSNMKLSVFVRYTPYSRKIYNISVLFDSENYGKIKEYIEKNIW